MGSGCVGKGLGRPSGQRTVAITTEEPARVETRRSSTRIDSEGIGDALND